MKASSRFQVWLVQYLSCMKRGMRTLDHQENVYLYLWKS